MFKFNKLSNSLLSGQPRQPPAPQYHHLSSSTIGRDTTRDKNESLIDESYLRPINENGMLEYLILKLLKNILEE